MPTTTAAVALLSLVAASALSSVPAVPAQFFGVDPVLVGIITILLLVVFALFLFVRKTLLSFSKGMRDGKDR